MSIINPLYPSNEHIAWDDLQGSISSVKLPAANDPAWRYYAFGIGGGVTFPVLGFDLNEYLYVDYQTMHSTKLESKLHEHIHYCTPTDGTGKKFKFQFDAIYAAVDGTWAVVSGSPFTHEVSMDGDFSSSHKLFDLAEMDAGINTTVSTLVKCKLTRIAASADEYGSEVYVMFQDIHHQKDNAGSREEYTK